MLAMESGTEVHVHLGFETDLQFAEPHGCFAGLSRHWSRMRVGGKPAFTKWPGRSANIDLRVRGGDATAWSV